MAESEESLASEKCEHAETAQQLQKERDEVTVKEQETIRLQKELNESQEKVQTDPDSEIKHKHFCWEVHILYVRMYVSMCMCMYVCVRLLLCWFCQIKTVEVRLSEMQTDPDSEIKREARILNRKLADSEVCLSQ